MMTDSEKLAWMNRRRRQLHVHSVLYYYMNECIIDDATFDRWSRELVAFQKRNPGIAKHGYEAKLFHDWTGETGMHLHPNADSIHLAEQLLDAMGGSTWSPKQVDPPAEEIQSFNDHTQLG